MTAALYLAKEVLIPLALAILFSFLLAPAVRRLERWLWRVPATLLVVLLAVALIGSVLAVAGQQALALAAQLPQYRQNIVEKIHRLRAPPRQGDLGRAADAIKDLQQEAAPDRPPIPVKESPGSALEAIAELLAPVALPAGMAIAVVVFTILMLLNRENLVERVIALLGPGRIHLMTRAMGEASHRVSRYLGMQLAVNAMFGVPFAIALSFIGVPNALLWGLLGMLLRFVPYAGVWVAAALPAALALAISDGWSMAAWTVGTFFALELLLAYVVEPWLYGQSAGLAPIAVIISVIFWTWLWGPVGLILATPLTVCVTVIGRHVPELGYLNVLLGVEPVLSPEQRFYQRLVALDQDDAAELAEKHAAAHGLAATFDELIAPALSLAERDRRKGALEPARERFIYDAARAIVEDVGEESPAAAGAQPAVCVVPAHDEADHIAAQMLARLLPRGQVRACVGGAPVLVAEVVKAIEDNRCAVVCISAVPPQAASRAGYLARRLRRHLPELKIVVGLWTGEGDAGSARERLLELGVAEVATRFADAAEIARQFASAPARA